MQSSYLSFNTIVHTLDKLNAFVEYIVSARMVSQGFFFFLCWQLFHPHHCGLSVGQDFGTGFVTGDRDVKCGTYTVEEYEDS